MHFTQAPFATESERDGHTGGWNSAFDRFAEFMLREQPGRKPAADEVPSELHLRRFFAAPRQMVFDAWTKPEMLKQWWGPKCFTDPVCEMDARGGGEIRDRYAGRRTERSIRWRGRFVEFYPPYRFHFTSGPVDNDGRQIFETWTSVFFEEVEGGTEVVLDVHVTKTTPEAAMYLKGMREGWSQSLDKLAEFVSSQTVSCNDRTTISSKGEKSMKMNVHLNFNGNCKDAFALYQKVFGAKQNMLMTYGEAPAGAPVPPDWKDKVMHTSIPLGGGQLMGCDAPPDGSTPLGGFQVSVEIERSG